MARLSLELPDRLAREAEQAGLLTPDAVETMLRDRLRRRAANEFLAKTTPTSESAMSPEDIQQEIAAVRAQGKRDDSGS